MPTVRGKLFVLGSVLVAGIALFLSRRWSAAPLPQEPFVIGKNNSVLFIVDDHHGLSNVHVATAHALLERHPHVKVHFASFAPLAPKLQRVSAYKSPGAADVVFHQIEGDSLRVSVEGTHGKRATADFVHPPGLGGIEKLCRDLQIYVSAWPGEQHMKMYHQINSIIDDVDPAVVVLDTLLRPATDATRGRNRLHAIITPNTLIDNFIGDQPYGKMFWKYPAMGSGIPYPVPWSRIPENIYLNFRVIAAVLWMPAMREKEAYLRSQGIKNPTNLLKLHREDVPWLTQTLAEASRPVDFIPPNVTCTGPMSLRLATAEEQDPELVAWLSRAPTVMVNLGSLFRYSREFAVAMAGAIVEVLEFTDVQVLWKFRGFQEENDIDTAFDGEVRALVQTFVDSGRLKVESWLTVDPTALLETGYIVASVHHGGAGCYHEAVATGVPAMILPQWVDLYNFAQLAEDIGIGVWGCPETSPYWNVACLRKGILRLIDGGEESIAIQAEAKRIGQIAQRDPGRYVAARMIAELAGSGRE